jgi:hypothetical protein
MKSSSVRNPPEHASYRNHRRQVWWQIQLPVLLAALVLLVAPIVAWLTTMSGGGDVARWAAISTIWLLLPVMIFGLIILVALFGVIFVAARLAGWIPRYSHRAQQVARRIAGGTRRGMDMVRRPVLAVHELGALARAGFHRLRERM